MMASASSDSPTGSDADSQPAKPGGHSGVRRGLIVAALVVAFGEGQELQPALRFACAAGGLATTTAGAMPSLPTRSVVDAALV